MKQVLKSYKEILNAKNEQELFCVVLTHCEVDDKKGGKKMILKNIDS